MIAQLCRSAGMLTIVLTSAEAVRALLWRPAAGAADEVKLVTARVPGRLR
jgi:hypothetical protein